VLAKCGAIVVHHWAHLADLDCDPWWEHETEWHRAWKALFPVERVEVAIGDHRADIVAASGAVIELQNSAIAPAEIVERERVYRRMVWVLNAAAFRENLFVMGRYEDSDAFKLRWRNHRSSWRFARKPVFLDLGDAGLETVLGTKAMVFEHPLHGPKYAVRRNDYRANDLEERLRGVKMLQLKTLHANGYRSVLAVDRERLIAGWLGKQTA